MKNLLKLVTIMAVLASASGLRAQSPAANPLVADVDKISAEINPQVVAWRRDFHKNPELGNRETRTSKIIADELRKLGFEVTTGVATTGVVGVLRGGRPGPVVALRSDMDALPVTEQVDVPFKSTAKAMWNGQETGVMHACGHDNHMAILLGTATALARMKDRLPGTVKVIFQPAEEGPPPGETGGAEQMVKESVLENPKVDAVFGLHVFPYRSGSIVYRPGPLMASADSFLIKVKGRQTHGAVPWGGIDPIVVGSQIVMGLQTIISRSVNITEAPAVVTVGRFTGGNRSNIVPDEVELEGTIRAFDESVRKDIQRRVASIATNIAESAGATATVTYSLGYPVTRNDDKLTERMLPTLRRAAGAENVQLGPLTGTAEDFSFFQQKVPGMFFFLGVTPKDQDPAKAAMNHSPLFFADEAALPVGVKVMTNLALDYLFGGK
ncbi:MAG TPA: amidohydrolase [Vicinamibacterales bacterium]|nr:amidohydrolase [Vicinamibacterales bacterium]